MTTIGDISQCGIWAIVTVDKDDNVVAANEEAIGYFGPIVGEKILAAFPWFREEWLYVDKVNARVVKTSVYDKVLMYIFKSKRNGEIVLYFRNIDEYRNLTLLWCEIEDSLIMLPFFDNSCDGFVITNRRGIIRATNQAFCDVSGLSEDNLLGKSIYALYKQGLLPQCSMMTSLENRQTEKSVAKFPLGKEAIISSKPHFSRNGELFRVLSNVRDITDLQELHAKIRTADAKVNKLQHQVDTKAANAKIDSIHQSHIMDELYELVRKVANTDIPLLILGESGVGKTVLAKQIHNLSDHKNKGSFVHLNCSAIPESLLESELFGYEAGAFSGATKTKIGLFESANKGTILLDEIGDMPLILQSKLLNVLQEKKFYRVGGTKPIKADARVIAATNQDLHKLIAVGRFRRDLYFRLNVIPVTIPALRERKEDIGGIIAHIIAEINIRYKLTKTLAPDTLLILESYDWPGNIRELKNVIERIMLLTKDDTIEPQHLPIEVRIKQADMSSFDESSMNNGANQGVLWNPGAPLKNTINHIELQIIEQAIALYGSVRMAAKKLGVAESTLARKRDKTKIQNQ